jgi:hypothetical protein
MTGAFGADDVATLPRLMFRKLRFLMIANTPAPVLWQDADLVFWGDATPYFGETNPVLTGDAPRTLGRRIPYLRETIPVLTGDKSRTYGRRIASQNTETKTFSMC